MNAKPAGPSRGPAAGPRPGPDAGARSFGAASAVPPRVARQSFRLAGCLAVGLTAGLAACGLGERDRAGGRVPSVDSVVLAATEGTVLSGQRVVRLERAVFAETLEAPVRIEADARRSLQVTSPAAGRIERVALRGPEEAVAAGETFAWLYSSEIAAAEREYLLLDPVRDADLARRAEERLARLGLTAGAIRTLRASRKPIERIPISSPAGGFAFFAPGGAEASGSPASAQQESAAGEGMGGMGGMGAGGGAEASGAGSGPDMGGDRTASGLQAGQYVGRGAPVAEINDLALVAAVVTLPARSASLFRVGDSVHVELDAAGFKGWARLDFLAARIADSSGNVEGTIYLDNPGRRFRIGLLGRAHLAPKPESAWVLPRAAVHDLGDRALAWERIPGEPAAFRARTLRLGRLGARQVEVLGGLEAGSEVAAEASLLLDPDAVPGPGDSWPGDPIRGDSGTGTMADGGEAEADHGGHGGAPRAVPEQGPHASHAPQAEPAPAARGPAPEGRASHPAAHAAPGDLILTPEQVRLAGIRTVTVGHARLIPTRTFRALTQWDATSRETVPARAEGRLDKVAVLRPGEKIARGQMLATLRSETVLAAQEEYLAALRHAPELPQGAAAAQGLASRRRLEVLGMGASQIEALARRGAPFPTLPIASPRDGILLEAMARPGRYVAAGAPLFAIGNADRIRVETWLLAEEAAAFPGGTEAWVRVEGVSGGPVPGRLEHIRQATGTAGSVALAHLTLPNPDGRILPGMQAWVTFRAEGRHALAVPAAAVLRSSNMATVWVETGEGRFAPRMVRMGLETPEAVEILTGLAPGEKAVTAGAYLLNSEWTLRQGGGMAHGGH